MTPLQEIEEAIEYVRQESDEYRRLELLAPLFQARALERLEATIRTLGVFMQNEYAIEERAKNPHPHRPHMQSAYVCRICGKMPGDPIHREPSPVNSMHRFIPVAAGASHCETCGKCADDLIHSGGGQ